MSEDARIFGDVVVMDGAVIAPRTVINGPAVIGPNVKILPDSLIDSTVLWSGSVVSFNCFLSNCVVYNNLLVAENTVAVDTEIFFDTDNNFHKNINRIMVKLNKSTRQLHHNIDPAIEKLKALLLKVAHSAAISCLWFVFIAMILTDFVILFL